MESDSYTNHQTNTSCHFYFQGKVVELPLVAIDYHVKVVNNLSRITLRQSYSNPLEESIELHFSFPIDTDFCFGALRARFQGYETEGVVMERQNAKKEYKVQVKQGNVAALATVSKAEQSVMRCRLGNLPAGQSVEIEYQISCELRAECNGHYLLRLPSHIAPRYNRHSCSTLLELFEQLFSAKLKERKFFTSFKWNFSIDLETVEALKEYTLVGEPHTATKISDRHVVFSLNEPVVPLHDISLTFSHEHFGKPQITSSPLAAYISLAPDSRTESIEQRQMTNFVGQFVFLLDRSGSMGGQKMNQAKQSLVLFLKSLPDQALFNIVSFGSDHKFMFSESVSYNDTNLTQAINQISLMGADMGGTEIAQPLKEIQNRIAKNAKNINVFVITDGQVSNTEEIIKINQEISQEKGGRVHMIGIGSGISVDMIKRGAQYGGGESLFILNESAMKKQIMGLLMKVTMPRLSRVQIEYDKEIVQEVVTNIEGDSINRGDHTHIIARFVPGVSEEAIRGSSILFKYRDEEDGSDLEHKIQLHGQVTFSDDTILKLFVYRQNQRLIQERAAPKWKEAVIENSIKYQVLSVYTAFLCKIKEVAHAKIEEPALVKLKNFMEGSSSVEHSKLITVSIKTLTGKSVDITISNLAYVEDLKQALEEIQGIPVDQQRMIFAGRQLDNYATLLDHSIGDCDTVHLVLRLRGGDGGSTSQPSVIISAYGIKLTIRQERTVREAKEKICESFPILRPSQLKLFLGAAELKEENKTLIECGVTADQRELTAVGPKLTDSNFFVSSMKADGSWIVDKEFLKGADLQEQMEELLKQLGDQQLAYTILVYQYMRKSFGKEEKELRMLYRKVQRFIEEGVKKAGVFFDLSKYLATQ